MRHITRTTTSTWNGEKPLILSLQQVHRGRRNIIWPVVCVGSGYMNMVVSDTRYFTRLSTIPLPHAMAYDCSSRKCGWFFSRISLYRQNMWPSRDVSIMILYVSKNGSGESICTDKRMIIVSAVTYWNIILPKRFL